MSICLIRADEREKTMAWWWRSTLPKSSEQLPEFARIARQLPRKHSPRRRLRTGAVIALFGIAFLAGCGKDVLTTTLKSDAAGPVQADTPALARATKPLGGKPTADCPLPSSGFDCDQQRRFAAAERYLRDRPGSTGIVVIDRNTGATWRNQHSRRAVWTASTIKLAMAVDLLMRQHRGSIRLSTADRDLLQEMLRSSDDIAANTLWRRFDGKLASARYPSYGMHELSFPTARKWGSAKCTTDDLARLMRYSLEKVPAAVSDYLTTQLQRVARNQQWGVWGAGHAAAPANKNGWWGYRSGWVINSVGAVGPGQRYIVALMNDLQGQGGYDDGVRTTTRVAELLFAGRFDAKRQ
jgi:hypothetical protein